MLVLGRRIGESIIIAENIRVTIVSVDGERVRIGIDAPSSVTIVRQELYEAVRLENLSAAQLSRDDRALPQLRRILISPSPPEH